MRLLKLRSKAFSQVCLLVCFSIGKWAIPLAADTRIILGPDASAVEHTAAEDLKADILKVHPNEKVAVLVSPLGDDPGFAGNTISLGTSESLGLNEMQEPLEPETFVLTASPSRSKEQGANLTVIGGDERGVLYGVYEFSRQVLRIDPMEFWTGKRPSEKSVFVVPELDYREKPPAFKIRGYRTEDMELLANWNGRKLVVELDTWKAVIDSLVRLRFNAIDCFGLSGRPEYYLRDYYKDLTEYHTDLELVEQVIDYAHSKGMLVQIPMNLGWEFKHLETDEICITSNFDRWMEIYRFYLAETPLGKGDLFLARPGHPIFDQEYRCPDEDNFDVPAGPLLEVVFSGLAKLINKFRPGGKLVGELGQTGREYWLNEEFSPRHEVQLLWADNDQGEFDAWPARTRAYAFGISIHAGVSGNQLVQNPYPDKIQKSLQSASARGMTESCWVNGPCFKAFILNLEASAGSMWDPTAFDCDAFYEEWTARYFGEEAAELAVSSLKRLQDAHKYAIGFDEVTEQSNRILEALRRRQFEAVEIGPVRTALALAQKSLELAIEAGTLVPENAGDVFDDQIVFPCRLFVVNLELLKSLIELNNRFRGGVSGKSKGKQLEAQKNEVREKLLELTAFLERGSRWQKWRNWSRPENFSMHALPPSTAALDSILDSF